MMTNQPPTEKWMPLQCIAGECSLSRMEYDATNLLVELDSFLEKRVIKVVFSDVFSNFQLYNLWVDSILI